MAAASGSLRNLCRENQYTGSAPIATTIDWTTNRIDVEEKIQYNGINHTRTKEE